MRRIIPHEELCMGCTLCQVYCTQAHSSSLDIIKAHRLEKASPRIKLAKEKPLAVAVQCHNCKNPPCVSACLTGAMHLDEVTGRVIHNRDKCVGCWTCVMVCPFGALIVDQVSKKPIKCDLCPNLEIPACVANCPNEALVLEEISKG